MFPTSTFRLTFFDRALCAQCSVKKSQSKGGSREDLRILPYNIMTLIVKISIQTLKSQLICSKKILYQSFQDC